MTRVIPRTPMLSGAFYLLVLRLDRRAGDEPPRSTAGPWRLG